jgi:competence protein ComEC
MGAAWTGAAGAGLALQRRLSPGVAAAAVAAAGLAGLRLDAALDYPVPPITAFVGQDVVATGVVVSEPDPGELTTAYDVRVEELVLPDGSTQSRPGTIRVWLHQYDRYLPGDRLRLEGELEEAPVFDTFDYRSYLARRGIGAVMWRPKAGLIEAGRGPGRELTRLRLALDRSLQQALPEPAASLAAGIAFGRDGGLSQEVKAEFNASGLRHLVAVSGANLVLVAAMTLALGSRLIGRARAWPLAATAVAGYVVLAGFEPSVARAAVMTAVLFAGDVVGRPQSGLPGLAVAVIVLTAAWPRLAVDPGFQLSAASTAGLITIGPWLRFAFDWARRWWAVSWLPGWATEVAALSIAASAATAPITWAHFGTVSAIGPLANVVVQPVVTLAFWASLATAALGLISRNAGELVGSAAYFPLAFILEAASAAARPSWATVGGGGASVGVAIGAMAMLAVASAAAYRLLPPEAELPDAAHERARMGNRLFVGGATGALALVVAAGSFGTEAGLTIDVLDVGQGDAILVTTPHGSQVLVDTGPSELRLARGLGEVMPPWDRTIEVVVVSHPQEDHIGGLPGLDARYHVRRVVTNGDGNTTRTAGLVEERLGDRTITAAAGDRFTVDGVTFEVLWPPPGYRAVDLNRRSLVLLVTYEGRRLLLAGDLDAGGQSAVVPAVGGPVDILKVPHHGSRDSDAAFLHLAEGGIAAISVGSGNPFGHPHPATVAALADALVLRTDEDGRIRIVISGGAIRVHVAR